MPDDYVKHFVKEGYYSVKELQTLLDRIKGVTNEN